MSHPPRLVIGLYSSGDDHARKTGWNGRGQNGSGQWDGGEGWLV